MKNYYEILEVNPKASEEIIKKIYKIKIKQNHPDLFQGEEKKKAEETTKEITEAYDILSDIKKREEYDLELKNSENITNSEKYQIIISNLKLENEYLKQVILDKNIMINSFLENTSVPPHSTDAFNFFSQSDQTNKNNTESSNIYSKNKKNYFNYLLLDLKQIIFRFLLLFIFLITVLLIFCVLSGNNIFEILF